MSVTKSKIEKNLAQIRDNIESACARSGRSSREISIVAVTKSVDAETIHNLLDVGLSQLAESRVQQLGERAEELAAHLGRRRTLLPAPPVWHMIGHLQRNKVKQVLQVASIIHSVDSLRLAEEINIRAEREARTVDVLLEINCSQEPQKHGVAVGAAVHMAELVRSLKNVRLVGLMTMAPLAEEAEKARPSFALLRELFEEIRYEKSGGPDFRHLSMGMSQDYPVAVEEGATLLRIGTALFQ
jgi:pyridoxal phosphate enzyme (YggS family)